MSFQPLSLHQISIDAVIKRVTGQSVCCDWRMPPGYFDHLGRLTRTMHELYQSKNDENYVLLEHVEIYRTNFVYPTTGSLKKLMHMFIWLFEGLAYKYETILIRPCETFTYEPQPNRFLLIMSKNRIDACPIFRRHRRTCPHMLECYRRYFQKLREEYQL